MRDTIRLVPGRRSVDVDWLHMLIADWQLIADLAVADLLLWVRDEVDPDEPGAEEARALSGAGRSVLSEGPAEGPRCLSWRVAAHVRPNTGPLFFYDDLVGKLAHASRRLALEQAIASKSVISASHELDTPIRRFEAVPVLHRGVPIGVVTRHSDRSHVRSLSPMEFIYRSAADTLFAMIRDGDFPLSGDPRSQRHGSPRVGDGVIRLDTAGVVDFVSPNATSALKRIGIGSAITGEYLSKVITDVIEDHTSVDETLPLVTMGRAAWRTDLEVGGGAMAMRAVPLRRRKARAGALVLVRDISELRRQERQLLTKDATIREIHHRVKNNLQTVAALLRLQARRVSDASAQSSLAEAGRRVSTIALVHDTLSRSLDEVVAFDEIAGRVVNAILEVAGGTVSWRKEGTFGSLAADDATALALVLAELVQNTVDHAFSAEGGTVTVKVTHEEPAALVVEILDDGVGLPEGFKPGRSGLGTQIVRAFVQDLRGTIAWSGRPEGGTSVRFTARLRATAHSSAG